MSAAPNPWRRVRLQQTPALPWRNGGGLTHELVSQPAVSWSWRVSVARVERDGPFSHFPGTHRQFAVLRGEGVHLDVGGVRHTLRAGGEVLAFDGGQSCHCSLIEGATQDFNLMNRAGHARLQRCTGRARPPWSSGEVAGIYACAAAQLQDAGGLCWSLEPDELLWTDRLPPGDWCVEGSDALVFAIAAKVHP
jgi:uncharacterized protein